MTKFEKLFPLKAQVTQEIIEIADPGHPYKCAGALTLKVALMGNEHLLAQTVAWGMTYGSNSAWSEKFKGDTSLYHITTKEEINFKELTHPTSVTFIIAKKDKKLWGSTDLKVRIIPKNGNRYHAKKKNNENMAVDTV